MGKFIISARDRYLGEMDRSVNNHRSDQGWQTVAQGLNQAPFLFLVNFTGLWPY